MEIKCEKETGFLDECKPIVNPSQCPTHNTDMIVKCYDVDPSLPPQD